MLYVYFGSDEIKVREEAFAFLHTLKDGSVEVMHVSNENFEPGILADLLESNSLFGGVKVVVFDTISQNKEMFEELLSYIKEFSASENHFVIIENTLLAGDKKKVAGVADVVHEYTKEKGETFNAFSLSDALLTRDKKKLWLLLQNAWRAQISNEEIVGILFWQLKVLRLAERTKSAGEADLKPFVYDKAKRALSKFKKGELDKLSEDLVVLYHEGHQGVVDMGLSIEKWVLQL